jgi:UDP-N-acetylmuramate--alanine ligase
MVDFSAIKHVHIIGLGGIATSREAKLLLQLGKTVSGSDVAASESVEELRKKGVQVAIGHEANNVPEQTDLVLYSSAVPESNPERAEARRRGIQQMTNFDLLADWTLDKQPLLVCGTHGKSTTTALLGLALAEGMRDPWVFVGSRVPGFPEGNIRFGASDYAVIEGDEYAKHFLLFQPSAVILNNIEWDHMDIFPDLESMIEAFRDLLGHVRDRGIVVANADDPRVSGLIGEERGKLEARGVRIRTFGFASHADVRISDHVVREGAQSFAVNDESNYVTRLGLQVPGRMNVMNATAAFALATAIGVTSEAAREALASFRGIWRRFEKVAEGDQSVVISDYGHHPTAVAQTLDAAKQWFPGKRVVLCFQPHHRNRTKHLFLDFVPSFDKADVLILSEIYDVAGREETEDADISSRDLEQAIIHHDADRGAKRQVVYVPDKDQALAAIQHLRKPGDVIIVMGAGDVYKIASKVLE